MSIEEIAELEFHTSHAEKEDVSHVAMSREEARAILDYVYKLEKLVGE